MHNITRSEKCMGFGVIQFCFLIPILLKPDSICVPWAIPIFIYKIIDNNNMNPVGGFEKIKKDIVCLGIQVIVSAQ